MKVDQGCYLDEFHIYQFDLYQVEHLLAFKAHYRFSGLVKAGKEANLEELEKSLFFHDPYLTS